MNDNHTGQEELHEIVRAYAISSDPAERDRLDARLWQRFGTEGAVVITDMCRFSSTTRNRGICHFLALIERARGLVGLEVERAGGTLVKFEVDNGFAYFAGMDAAFEACRAIDARLRGMHRDGDSEIVLSMGIDFGRLLLIGNGEFFGDPVNTASKLSEDLAGQGEILATQRAIERLGFPREFVLTPKHAKISGIDIDYSEVEFLHLGHRR